MESRSKLSRLLWNRKTRSALTLTLLTAILCLAGWYFLDYPPILIWFACITIVTASAFAYDKLKAQKSADESQGGKGRIPEAALLWLCLIGGTIGGIIVMLGRRHKTVDRRFRLGVFIVIIIQAIAIGFYIARHFFAGE